MSRGRVSPIGIGVALGAVAVAGVAGAAGLVADRVRRREDAALPEYASLVQEPSSEHVVVASDGVPIYVAVDEPEIDEPGPDGVAKPTVVFTHGYCLTSQCWVLQRRALRQAGYRVVSWDQRGHGRSEKGDQASCRIEQLGEDLYAVLQATVPDGDVALVGHSMGGMTILAMAEAHPDVIRTRVVAFGCVATSAGGLPLASGGFVAVAGKLLLERLGPGVLGRLAKRPELLAGLLRANRDLEEFLVERYSFASPVPRSVVRLTAGMILGTDLGVMSDFVPTFDAYDKTTALQHFAGVETLVFNGMHDILTPPAHSESIVRGIPGAEHVLIRDGGHVIMLEHPELLSDQLLGLLERAELARTRHVDVGHKPHVTQIVTPVGKKLAVRRGLRERRRQRSVADAAESS